MRLVRDIACLTPPASGLSLALGNFDGVHQGHQAVIREAVAHARSQSLLPAVVTFAPHPRRFFQPDSPSLSLSSFREKCLLMKALGVELLIALRFNASLASLSPHAFVTDVLLRRLNARFLSVGHNFRFGKERAGDAALLEEAAQAGGCAVHRTEEIRINGELCSSSRIRDALLAGDVAKASLLLGRPYAISGHVMHGDKRGRLLGFPTANLSLSRRFLPARGVYAAWAAIENAPEPLPAVVNLGARPTFDGQGVILEAHMLRPPPGSLYGERLHVSLVRHLRPERRFPGIDALKERIRADCLQAASVLGVSHDA